MASCVSSEPSEVTRSHAVRSTTTEENMTMPEARLTWGGRCLVGWLTGPLSQVAPNSPHPHPGAPLRGFSGSSSGAGGVPSPMCRMPAARRGLDP